VSLISLVFGVGVVSVYFAGESNIVGLLIGIGFISGASIWLLEIGRQAGAPQQGWQVIFPAFASVGLALGWIATRSLFFALTWMLPLFAYSIFAELRTRERDRD
jgi:hypothetical protein